MVAALGADRDEPLTLPSPQRGEGGTKNPLPTRGRGQGEGVAIRERYWASATWPFSRRRRSRFAKDSALMMRSNWLR